MALNIARPMLPIEPNKKVAFERLCAWQGLAPSQVKRQHLRDYFDRRGVQYVSSRLFVNEFQPFAEVAATLAKSKSLSNRGALRSVKRRSGLKEG